MFAVKVVRIPQLKKKDLEGLKEEVRVMQRVRAARKRSWHQGWWLWRGVVTRFRCAQLRHKNIVRLEEVYRTASMVHIVTELCSGGELFDQIIKKVRWGVVPTPRSW